MKTIAEIDKEIQKIQETIDFNKFQIQDAEEWDEGDENGEKIALLKEEQDRLKQNQSDLILLKKKTNEQRVSDEVDIIFLESKINTLNNLIITAATEKKEQKELALKAEREALKKNLFDLSKKYEENYKVRFICDLSVRLR